MNIAITILVFLAIFVRGTLTINGKSRYLNWLCLIAFVLCIINFFVKGI